MKFVYTVSRIRIHTFVNVCVLMLKFISNHSQHQGGHQQSAARFTFAESATRTSEGIDDTRIDLTQLDESGARNTSTIATQSPGDTSSNNASITIPTVETIEPIAGTSTAEEANVPQILVDEVEGELNDSSLSFSHISLLL